MENAGRKFGDQPIVLEGALRVVACKRLQNWIFLAENSLKEISLPFIHILIVQSDMVGMRQSILTDHSKTSYEKGELHRCVDAEQITEC